MFMILLVLAAIGAIITFTAKKKLTKGLLIATVVFGILSCTEVSAVGAIMALVIGRNGNEPQPIEAQANADEVIE